MAYGRSWAVWVAALVVLRAEPARADEPPPTAAFPPIPPAPPTTTAPPPASAPPTATAPQPAVSAPPGPPSFYAASAPVDSRPKELPYVGGEPAPPGYRLESRPLRGAVISGASIGGTTYGLNLLIVRREAARTHPDWRHTMMYFPGLGTWGFVPDVCTTEEGVCPVVVLHSAAHTAGLVLLVYGLTARKKRYLLEPGPVTVAPMLGTGAAGLTLGGQF